MRNKEPKSLKKASYASYYAEGKLYAAVEEWKRARQDYLDELKKHVEKSANHLEGELFEEKAN